MGVLKQWGASGVVEDYGYLGGGYVVVTYN